MSTDDIWPPRAPAVGWWLILVCALVVAMILVGGATRLTESGLSITEWDLGKGLIPPLSDARWAEEFALYQRTVQYEQLNYGMSLEEFQRIYWWEWGHRFLGKVLGLVYALPFFFFLFTGRLRGRFRATIALFVLGGLQGAVGWWMVTSGLFERTEVSPARLAVHMGMALIILALGLWVALGAFAWPRRRGKLGAPRWTPVVLMALVFAQAMFGALLAGSGGGAAYADWPRIGGEWIPSSAFGLEPLLANFTEDHATQHLLHRTLGYVTALGALGLSLAALLGGTGAARGWALGVGALALAQAGLGIAAVLLGSPLWISLVHQGGAVALWIAALVSWRAACR